MSAPLRIRQLHIYPLAIPMRLRFEHAAAARSTADPVVVQLSAAAPYAHHVGYGETLARPYVTGETAESVLEDLERLYAPLLDDFRPETFADALEFIEALPSVDYGRVTTAARAAFELALLDVTTKAFQRRPVDVCGWLDLPGFGPPGCLAQARYSGIVVGKSRGKLRAALRAQRCYGLRDFKIKVATDGWQERLAWTHGVLRRQLAAHQVTLRADANGAWTLAEANEAVEALESCGVSALEQPISEAQDDDLAYLAGQTRCDLIVDESLLTVEDARRLVATRGVRVLNIRIAKNGGLMPALRMARLALAAGLDVQLGCLVGETSILTAAGIAFLEACPKVRFVEGAFGAFLLRADVTRRPLRFGRGGRLGRRPGPGFGVKVEPERLGRLCPQAPRSIRL